MTSENALQIVNEAIEAHGGREYWNSLEALDVVISARGFLFTAKQRPILDHVRMRAYTKEAKFLFFGFPNPGETAELIGNSEVRILDGKGTVISRRENPRRAFHGMRRLVRWDDLDFIYFAGFCSVGRDLSSKPSSPQRGSGISRACRPHSPVTCPRTLPSRYSTSMSSACFGVSITRPKSWADGLTPRTCAKSTARSAGSKSPLIAASIRSCSGSSPCPVPYW
jgi:hypothetical protein